MTARTRTLLIVLIGAALAATAGLYFAGVLGGGSDKVMKYAMEPIALHEPFTINLADTDTYSYAKFNVALQLEDMTQEDRDLFLSAAGGGHGGGTELGGADRVAQYPKFRDAVIDVASLYTSSELLSKKGKEQLKADLLARFDKIARADKRPKDDKTHDPSHPPYHVTDVFLQEFVIQPGGAG